MAYLRGSKTAASKLAANMRAQLGIRPVSRLARLRLGDAASVDRLEALVMEGKHREERARADSLKGDRMPRKRSSRGPSSSLRKRFRVTRRGGGSAELHYDDGDALQTRLIDVTVQQLRSQVNSYTALETKAVGLLAVDGALATAMGLLVVPREMAWGWELAIFLPLLVSVLLVILCLSKRKVLDGPVTAAFYTATRQYRDVDALGRLLTSLSADYDKNRERLELKGLYCDYASYSLMVAIGAVIATFLFGVHVPVAAHAIRSKG
jgi:hypothetical protein